MWLIQRKGQEQNGWEMAGMFATYVDDIIVAGEESVIMGFYGRVSRDLEDRGTGVGQRRGVNQFDSWAWRWKRRREISSSTRERIWRASSRTTRSRAGRHSVW